MAPTQNPQAVQETCRVLGIQKRDVTCHVTLLGEASGRKSKPDQVAEKPLSLQTTRQAGQGCLEPRSDIHFDFFHSVARDVHESRHWGGMASRPRGCSARVSAYRFDL